MNCPRCKDGLMFKHVHMDYDEKWATFYHCVCCALHGPGYGTEPGLVLCRETGHAPEPGAAETSHEI